MKRNTLAALLFVFLLILSACGGEQVQEATAGDTAPSTEAACVTVPQTEPPQTVPVQTLPPATEAPTQPSTLPPETSPPISHVSGALALRDHLRDQTEAGRRHFSFRYTGAATDVTAQNIARIGGYFYVEAHMDGDLCTVSVVDYPGDRIVAAWRSGNTALLTEPEQQALQIAEDFVAQARQTARNELELEQLLFDIFRSHVSYNDGSTEIADPLEPPRHLTAVGALVDGSANCQGYADGFYVLASIAGFRTERMHVDIPEGGHTVNVILLDGAWYVVDATYNDFDDPSGVQISYALLNVGKDKCMRYSWTEEMARYPIVEQTDHHNFYYAEGSENTCRFADLEAMAQHVVDDWLVYGTSDFFLMLEGQTAGWQDLGTVLEQTAAAAGTQITYTIWHEQNVRDTYFFVLLG